MVNKTSLKTHFPLIRDRRELLEDIRSTPALQEKYNSWNEEQRKEFLDCCTGVKGMKILYDSFFKEAFNCEYDRSRLEELLSILLKKKVTIRQYKRMKASKGKKFSYRDIKNVYLIVIFDESPAEFKAFPDIFLHHGKQRFDSGLEIDMLQEYIFVPLDRFRESMQ